MKNEELEQKTIPTRTMFTSEQMAKYKKIAELCNVYPVTPDRLRACYDKYGVCVKLVNEDNGDIIFRHKVETIT